MRSTYKEAVDSLLDVDRTKNFQLAITRTVMPGDRVVDCGTGTGILAITAAKTGAKKVIAIEKDKKVCNIARENVKISGFQDTIEVVNRDAACEQTQADVVITQLFDTLLICEDQLRVVNALIKKGTIAKKTRIIPKRASTFFEPVFYDFEFFDCHMPMIVQADNDRCIDALSSPAMCCDLHFNSKNPAKVHYDAKIVIRSEGWLNAFKFTTILHLTDDLILGPTKTFCIPTFVPVHEMMVKRGEVLFVTIDYQMGGGYETLKVNCC